MKKHARLLSVLGAGVVIVGLYFGYQSLFRSKCDVLFQQTSDQLRAHVDVIKTKGEIALGRARVQELTESSQKAALNLQACCLGPRGGSLDAAQFQACVDGAHQYEIRLAAVSRTINEVQAARAQGNAALAAQKAEQAQQAAGAAIAAEKDLGKRVEIVAATTVAARGAAPDTPAPAVKGGAEQEPNDTIFVANAAEMGAATTSEVAPGTDIDVFKFQYRDAKNRRDIVAVHLENQSTTLFPSVRVLNDDKSVRQDWFSPNAAGANVDYAFVAEAGKTYYVAVGAKYSQSTGKYALSVTPRKAYDRHEPNDAAFTATPLKLGETIEAGVMDGEDIDWYRVSGVKATTLTIVLENGSATLQPSIRVHNADKSIARDWTAANAAGADLTTPLPAEPGKDYFVVVGARYGQSHGKYRLSTR